MQAKNEEANENIQKQQRGGKTLQPKNIAVMTLHQISSPMKVKK